MANKKITQLNTLDSAVGIGTEAWFTMVSGTSSTTYQTVKVKSPDLAKFILNPIPVGGEADLSAIGFTGTSNIYFDKSNWVDTSNAGTHAFVMVDKTNGQLTTGSGIGVVAGGDNMGDCKATQAINMQGNDINNLDQVRFQGASDSIFHRSNTTDLILKAENDLNLSGQRHVAISGQALNLSGTPISGDVTITGGNLEIDPGNKLIVNEISGVRAGGSDDALLSIEGSSRHVPYAFSPAGSTVNWQDSNIQYAGSTSAGNIDFENVADGQTLTLYWQNTNTDTTSITPKFRSGDYGTDTAGAVRWGAEFSHTAPAVAPSNTNVYTFARINTGIFASAVTGYVY